MKVIKLLEKSAKDKMVKTAAGLLTTNPEKNVDRLFTLIEKTIAKDEDNLKRLKVVEDEYYNNPSTHELYKIYLKLQIRIVYKSFSQTFLQMLFGMACQRERNFLKKRI